MSNRTVTIFIVIVTIFLVNKFYYSPYYLKKESNFLFSRTSHYKTRPFSKTTFYNSKKELLIADTFIQKRDCDKVLLCRNTKQLYGIISKAGKVVWSPIFTNAGVYYKSIFAVKYKDYFGFLDSTGTLVIPFQFLEVTHYYGKVFGGQDSLGKWNLYNKYGEKLNSIKVGKIHNVRHGNVVAFEGSNGIGFMSRSGKLILKPQFSNFIKSLFNSYWRVEKNKLWGVLDGDGNIIVPIKYDGIEDYQDGKFKVYLNKQSFFVNKQGKLVE